ncbi:MAG: FecCD family ABC transporter permease [Myxococcota bacterium]
MTPVGRGRAVAAGVGAGLLLLAVVVAASAVGTVDLPLGTTARVLASAVLPGAAAEVEGWHRAVILDVRLPRVLLAAMAGGGLGLAGAVMQGLFRNPMADPAVVGVSGGSALGAVSALYLVPPAADLFAVPVAAFAGGLGCALVVYALATSRGRTEVLTLLLAGIAVGSIANALTSFVLSLAVADWEVGKQMLVWIMGSLEGRTWQHVAMAAPLVLGGSLWLGVHTRELNALLTGEESALAVGVDVPRVKRDLLVLAALVTAATVAVMGIVAFVGLMVPHMVRLVVGPDHRRVLPLSFLTGAIFLVLADLLTRTAPTAELRLGVVTALAGGPFFLYLLLRHRRALQGAA